MTPQNNNVPALRFSEFSEDLKESNLGQVASFTKGKGISKLDIDENGKFECIRYGELYTHYGETIQSIKSKTNLDEKELVFSEHNDVIIPASGETQIDIATASCVLKSGVALGGDLNIIKTKLNGVFLSYYLNNRKKKDIACLAQGSSVVHLYANQLKTLQLNLPTLPEQQKIAAFLTAVDEKIQQFARKKDLLEQYKKGVMQKIFNQEIRFKDDNGNDFADWEEKKLGDLITLVIDNRGKTPPVLSEGMPLIEVTSVGNKMINYSVVKKYVDGNTYKTWFRKYLQNGDILFSTVGNTALCSVYEDKVKAGVAQNLVGLRFDNDFYLFMFYLLTEKKNNNKFKEIQMGAVQPSVKVSQMIHLFFSVPTLKEQEKIGNFLSAIDDRINLISEQIEKTKEYKKGLLQQMFI